ncbi:MAG TPA: hypothetical protein VH120_15785 [Gemmataceae bacterium]|jgi:hypothetical protein|nr:hypothetical protein [Gemmataceae bacterium]
MADTQLTLTANERDQLVELLQEVLKETRVEEHRTRAPSFREIVLQKERAIASVLGKPVS